MLLKKSKTSLKIVAEHDFKTPVSEASQQQLIAAIQDNSKQEIVLVFNEVQEVDASGLKLIVGLSRECARKSLQLSLVCKNKKILELIRLCKLDQQIIVKEA